MSPTARRNSEAEFWLWASVCGTRCFTTLLLGCCSLLPYHLHAETVREQMLSTTAYSRNSSFSTFLRQHGKSCAVTESKFGVNLNKSTARGDIWWAKCSEGYAFAIFIADDAKSTSWFMPCESITEFSNLRCFESAPIEVIFK